MNIQKRIFINTISIYIGVLFSMIVSLITVPILLNCLGASDFGLLNLIVGVITMLSFMRNSMIVTVQRFMNVAMGANDMLKVSKVYSISFLLYLFVAVLSAVLIELIMPVLINDFMNIEPYRISITYYLFHVFVVSMFFNTLSIPLDALFNVHEEMWFFSMFNFLDTLLRFLLVIFLVFIPFGDNLLVYAIGLGSISILNFIMKFIFCKKRYSKIKFIKLKTDDKYILKEIISFISLNLYSTLARLFSTQGFALVLNHFMGTIANASYGIANQINGVLMQFTNSVDKAFNPQIMKNEGAQQQNSVISLALLSTKYCSLIYSFLAIPFLFALPFILKFWLQEIPEYTIGFSSLIIIASMVSMLSVGITSIFYAMGKVKFYLITMGTLLIVNVFIAYIFFTFQFNVYIVFTLFILLEILLLFVRVFYARIIARLDVVKYLQIVIFPYLKVTIPVILVSFLIQTCDNKNIGVLLNVVVSILLYIILVYKLSLSKNERSFIDLFFLKIKNKIV